MDIIIEEDIMKKPPFEIEEDHERPPRPPRPDEEGEEEHERPPRPPRHHREGDEEYGRPPRPPRFDRKNQFDNDERHRRGGRNIWKRREERKKDYVGEHFGKKRFIQRRNRGSERTKRFGNRGYYMKRRNRFN